MVAGTKALKEYQESEDSEEALNSLPMLSRKDIDRMTPLHPDTEQIRVNDTTYLRHHYKRNRVSDAAV